MKLSSVIVAFLSSILFFHGAEIAAEPLTSEQGDAILKELKEIKTLLQNMAQQNRTKPARQRPTKARVKAEGSFYVGNKNAPLTLVEFTDFQCPFCRRFHEAVFPELKKKYIDSGKLRYVSRDLPLRIHANALLAANAGRCAGEQDKFWELRDAMFAHSRNLKQEAIVGYAKNLSLNMGQFQRCLEARKYNPNISKDINAAKTAGLTGTPSFVLGKTGADGYVDGMVIIGAKSLPYMESKIKGMLTQK
jgi:protein-disulfide isomerase